MEAVKISTDTLFILLGAIMVLAMHAGFAFLEVGTVRRKNQVNALVKILCDFAVSTIIYFFIGYGVAYGVSFAGSEDSVLRVLATDSARDLPFEIDRTRFNEQLAWHPDSAPPVAILVQEDAYHFPTAFGPSVRTGDAGLRHANLQAHGIAQPHDDRPSGDARHVR